MSKFSYQLLVYNVTLELLLKKILMLSFYSLVLHEFKEKRLNLYYITS